MSQQQEGGSQDFCRDGERLAADKEIIYYMSIENATHSLMISPDGSVKKVFIYCSNCLKQSADISLSPGFYVNNTHNNKCDQKEIITDDGVSGPTADKCEAETKNDDGVVDQVNNGQTNDDNKTGKQPDLKIQTDKSEDIKSSEDLRMAKNTNVTEVSINSGAGSDRDHNPPGKAIGTQAEHNANTGRKLKQVVKEKDTSHELPGKNIAGPSKRTITTNTPVDRRENKLFKGQPQTMTDAPNSEPSSSAGQKVGEGGTTTDEVDDGRSIPLFSPEDMRALRSTYSRDGLTEPELLVPIYATLTGPTKERCKKVIRTIYKIFNINRKHKLCDCNL